MEIIWDRVVFWEAEKSLQSLFVSAVLHKKYLSWKIVFFIDRSVYTNIIWDKAVCWENSCDKIKLVIPWTNKNFSLDLNNLSYCLESVLADSNPYLRASLGYVCSSYFRFVLVRSGLFMLGYVCLR